MKSTIPVQGERKRHFPADERDLIKYDSSTVECISLTDLRNALDQTFGEDKTKIFMEQIRKTEFIFNTLPAYMAK